MIDLWHGETAFALFLTAAAIILVLTYLRDRRQQQRQCKLNRIEWQRKLLIDTKK